MLYDIDGMDVIRIVQNLEQTDIDNTTMEKYPRPCNIHES